jgi:hypothetical protein
MTLAYFHALQDEIAECDVENGASFMTTFMPKREGRNACPCCFTRGARRGYRCLPGIGRPVGDWKGIIL